MCNTTLVFCNFVHMVWESKQENVPENVQNPRSPIREADESLTTKSREASKPRDSGLYSSIRSEIRSAYMHVKFQSDMMIIISSLAALSLHQKWW